MTTQLAPLPIFRGWDNNGNPLVGGQLFTYVAGTITPQASWTDATQSQQNTNPVVLNARGEASIWLDPSLVYKLALQDSSGNPIWTVDKVQGNISFNPNVNIIPATTNTYTLGSPSVSWANIYLGPNAAPALDNSTGNIVYYARTPAEVAAAITPVNFVYPPLNVLRYGADQTGATDSSAAFTNAGKVAMVSGGSVYIPAPNNYYLLTNPINWTVSSTATQNAGFNVRMDGNNHAVFGSSPQQGTLHAVHAGNAVIDITGGTAITFNDLNITTDPTTFPKCGILTARNSSGASIQGVKSINCRIFGYFSVACYYDYGSEDDSLVNCYFVNLSTSNTSFNGSQAPKVCVWTNNNIANVTSPFVTMFSGASSTLHHTVISGNYAMFGTPVGATADVFYLDGASFFEILDIWTAASGGNSIIRIDGTNSTSLNATIIGLEVENGAAPSLGVDFGQPGSAQIPVNWSFRDCYFANITNILHGGSNVTASGFRLSNISSSGNGISWGGGLAFGFIETDALLIALTGVAPQNTTFIGSSHSWTFTNAPSSTNPCKFVDTSNPANRTWTPGTSNFTGTGISTSATEFSNDGTEAAVTFAIAGTNLAWAAGVQITGLPVAPTRAGGLVSVFDNTGATYQGAGWVTGAGLFLQNSQAASAHTFTITARYFVG